MSDGLALAIMIQLVAIVVNLCAIVFMLSRIARALESGPDGRETGR